MEGLPVLFDGDSVTVRELFPGDVLKSTYMTSFDMTDPWDLKLFKLEESLVKTLDGSTVSIPVRVEPMEGEGIPEEIQELINAARDVVSMPVDNLVDGYLDDMLEAFPEIDTVGDGKSDTGETPVGTDDVELSLTGSQDEVDAGELYDVKVSVPGPLDGGVVLFEIEYDKSVSEFVKHNVPEGAELVSLTETERGLMVSVKLPDAAPTEAAGVFGGIATLLDDLMGDGATDVGTATFKAKEPLTPEESVHEKRAISKDEIVTIRTAEDLDKVREDLDGFYVLANDIDLAGFNGGQWVPIGDNGGGFTGIFYGGGHTIKNLKITEDVRQYNGLFGVVELDDSLDGMVIDVHLAQTRIVFDSDMRLSVGGICGYLGSEAILYNCSNSGMVSISADDYFMAGGICGQNHGMIVNCQNTALVSASTTGGICAVNEAGGYVGLCSNDGTIQSYRTSKKTAILNYYAGGISGVNMGRIGRCGNTGAVSSAPSSNPPASVSGGISAQTKSSGAIIDCYNAGGISASIYEGSLAAAGGIGGRSAGGIANTHNAGNVRANNPKSDVYAGGICGQADDGSGPGHVESSVYVSGNVTVTGGYEIRQTFLYLALHTVVFHAHRDEIGTSKSGERLSGTNDNKTNEDVHVKNEASYTDLGWDFVGTWCRGKNYPELVGISRSVDDFDGGNREEPQNPVEEEDLQQGMATLTYYEKEGPSSPYAVTETVGKEAGASFTVREGASAPLFTEWNTEADGSGWQYIPGYEGTIGEEGIELYAQYEYPADVMDLGWFQPVWDVVSGTWLGVVVDAVGGAAEDTFYLSLDIMKKQIVYTIKPLERIEAVWDFCDQTFETIKFLADGGGAEIVFAIKESAVAEWEEFCEDDLQTKTRKITGLAANIALIIIPASTLIDSAKSTKFAAWLKNTRVVSKLDDAVGIDRAIKAIGIFDDVTDTGRIASKMDEIINAVDDKVDDVIDAVDDKVDDVIDAVDDTADDAIDGQTTTFYRVMSEGEYSSLMENKKFMPYELAMEEKWFATNQVDASKWAEVFYPDGKYRMIELEIYNKNMSKMYYVAKLDDIGPAYCSSLDVINDSIKSIREVTQ